MPIEVEEPGKPQPKLASVTKAAHALSNGNTDE